MLPGLAYLSSRRQTAALQKSLQISGCVQYGVEMCLQSDGRADRVYGVGLRA